MRRGEIWWASLPTPAQSAPGYRRPVLIIQADAFNRSRISTVVAAALTTNLRLADAPIHSDLIPRGRADIIISMEPMEGLRYLDYLSPEGTLITSTDPVVNIPDYPDLEQVLATARELNHSILVPAESLARQAGSGRASNMVMVGAASHLLPISVEALEQFIEQMFARKGDKVVTTNRKAFQAGIDAAR